MTRDDALHQMNELLAQLKILRERVRGASADGIDPTAAAENVIDEMARRQGFRLGPRFDWSLATELYQLRIHHAFTQKSPEQSLVEFVRSFVDAWPQGMAALRLDPADGSPMSQPPYAKEGLWPAYLGTPDRKD